MKVLLANDTGIVDHLGCRGVSDAHARLLGRAGHRVAYRLFRGSLQRHDAPEDAEIVRSLNHDDRVMNMIHDVDAVIVNGEGTIHHGRGRPWLGLLAVAQRLNRLTLLVNAVFQGASGFVETLAKLDDFAVREGRSAAWARACGLRPRVVPDSYLAAAFAPASRPLSGVVVTDWHAQRPDVGKVVQRYRDDNECDYLPLRSPDAGARWAGLPNDIRGARVMVTARHHGVYAAIVAGLPFVALPSNTHKIEGTLSDLGLSRLLVLDGENLLRQQAWATDHPEIFRTLRERLTDGGALTTFAALGVDGTSCEDAEVARLELDVRHAMSGDQ